MRLFIILFVILISFTKCKEKNEEFKKISLQNEGILKIKDSIRIKLDSLTVENSDFIYLEDSTLFICNSESNLVSKIELGTNKASSIYLSNPTKEKFNSIYVSKSKIYALNKISRKGFIFSKNGYLLDSFKIATKEDKKLGEIITDNPLVSKNQPLFEKDSIIYSLGFALIEGEKCKKDSRYVLCKSSKGKNDFFVNYPSFYNGKNWGGTYLRYVYGASVGDSLYLISFPANSQIAKFNIRTKQINYVACYPEIDSLVNPVGKIDELKIGQREIAKHFFKQYSFQALKFDKYRNIFYRILFKPIENYDKSGASIGKFSILILAYNFNFKYIGFSEISGEEYSKSTYLIHPRGLLIQKNSLNKNEENINFSLFTIDTTYINRLQIKR